MSYVAAASQRLKIPSNVTVLNGISECFSTCGLRKYLFLSYFLFMKLSELKDLYSIKLSVINREGGSFKILSLNWRGETEENHETDLSG
jgi:hypothetical protein